MIATFIIDWPILMFLGLVFGLFAAVEQPWSSRAFKAGLATAVTFSSTAFISYLVAPDWMWMYFLDPDRVVWSLPFIALGYLGTFVVGFAAALGLRVLSRSYVVGAALAALVAEVVVVAITWDRYRAVGTTEQWVAGHAFPLLGTTPEGPVQVIGPLGPVFAVVFIGAVVWTVRGRRAAASDR